MKNFYSIRVIRKGAGVALGSSVLDAVIKNGGIISFIDVDRSLFDCRITFTNRKARQKCADVLANVHIDFLFPEYDLKRGFEND